MSDSRSDTIEVQGLTFEIAGISEQGPRSENQDAYTIDRFASTGIIAVADGMGGERSGRLAADTALDAVLNAGPIRSLDDVRRAVRNADATVVRSAGSNPNERGGMGCALGVMAFVRSDGDGMGWIGAHVGDVRIMSRSPDGVLRLETRDHTPAYSKWEAGEITLDEIPDTAGANRLQRAVGRGGEADATWLPARPGWSWLLVSDGIYKSVRLDELSRLIDSDSATEALEAIRKKVEERGPEDNYTAVLIRALGGPTPNRASLPVFDDRTMEQPSNTSRGTTARSGTGLVALLLALLALGAAGFALWMAWQTREEAARSTVEMQRLQLQFDSMQTQAQADTMARLFSPTSPGGQRDSAPANPGQAPG
jgi:PPM family protein phosphatase